MTARTIWRSVPGLLPAAIAVAVGCGRSDDAGPIHVAQERVTRPRKVAMTPMRPLTPAPGVPPVAAPAPPSGSGALRLPADVSIDARVLIITADGTDAGLVAIVAALGYLGTPYEVLNATSGPALTAAALADGDHGKYQAIFLDLGDLSDSGTSAFTSDEWATLAAYEARFGVRRVSLYTYPSAGYGLSPASGAVDPKAAPVRTRCSAAGAAAFVGTNCANPVSIDMGWAYPARAADAQTVPLLADDAGNVYAAIHTNPDGRETLALTFAQASYAFYTLQLAYGLVSWATRGLFVGERHVYLSAQIDDLFLPSSIYPGTGVTYRMTGADMHTLADWQSGRRANPLVAGLRLAWAANLQGSRGVANDPLTAAAVTLGPAFSWISHTWDHTDLTNMGYVDAHTEFSLNDQTFRGLGLTPYKTANLVTPGITGLDNVNAMQAAYDVGIRQLVSDTSIDGQDNPSPNAGRPNALVPGILEIPRYPTDLDYDVSLPEEWIAATLGRENRQETYDQIIESESQVLAGHLLRGANDPWMFHQANTRDYGGGRSLLSDLLGATIDRYLATATFPISSPDMDVLAGIVSDRMRFDASGVSATIGPGDRMTVQVARAARVPVTGLCTPDAETYGGQKIAYLDLPAGGSATLSLADCSGPITGVGGAGGASGAGGAGASGNGGTTGGATGGGGANGNGGVSGIAGAMGGAGTNGGAGASGNGGTTGTGGVSPTGGGGANANGGANGGAGATGSGGAGATGSGGAGAMDGAVATGNGGAGAAAGTNGAAGAHGSAGHGGSTIAQEDAGLTGEGGANALPDAGDNNRPPPLGCDCTVTGGSPGSGAVLLTLVAALVVSRRRRK